MPVHIRKLKESTVLLYQSRSCLLEAGSSFYLHLMFLWICSQPSRNSDVLLLLYTMLRSQAYSALSRLLPGCWNLNTGLQHSTASTVNTVSSLQPQYIDLSMLTFLVFCLFVLCWCVYVRFWVHVHHMCVRPCGRQKGCWILWNHSYRDLRATPRVLGTNLGHLKSRYPFLNLVEILLYSITF